MHRLLHGIVLVVNSRLRIRVTTVGICACVFFAVSMTANAQFKEVGPPPYSSTVARQRIKALLEKVDPGNGLQTVATLSGLLVWYRDLFDEELIAAWQRDGKANLTQLIKSLADSRVASALVEFSWRQQRSATFNLTWAPMFGDLMARYPDSARPFLGDLLGPAAPDLSQPEAEAVCRILLDMPDTETWKKSALQILPRYRRVAEGLLDRDLHGDDQEKMYRAQLWLGDLKSDVPGIATDEQGQRRRRAVSQSSVADPAPMGNQAPAFAMPPRAHVNPPPAPGETNSRSAPAPPPSTAPIQPTAPVQPASLPYNGPKSGTLECSGVLIPQNGEYVFPDLPPGKMQFDYDTKIWEMHLLPGAGQSQRLVLTNKRPGAQKRCVVHWSVVP